MDERAPCQEKDESQSYYGDELRKPGGWISCIHDEPGEDEYRSAGMGFIQDHSTDQPLSIQLVIPQQKNPLIMYTGTSVYTS